MPGYFNDPECASYSTSGDDGRDVSLTIPISIIFPGVKPVVSVSRTVNGWHKISRALSMTDCFLFIEQSIYSV